MGETYINVRVRRLPEDDRCEELRLIVDTREAYSWIPRRVLERLDIKPVGKRKFKTICGNIIERELGHIFIEHEGDYAPTTVVFAEKGDATVFGLHGMESLGLEIDPVTRQIRKSEALLAL